MAAHLKTGMVSKCRDRHLDKVQEKKKEIDGERVFYFLSKERERERERERWSVVLGKMSVEEADGGHVDGGRWGWSLRVQGVENHLAAQRVQAILALSHPHC